MFVNTVPIRCILCHSLLFTPLYSVGLQSVAGPSPAPQNITAHLPAPLRTACLQLAAALPGPGREPGANRSSLGIGGTNGPFRRQEQLIWALLGESTAQPSSL